MNMYSVRIDHPLDDINLHILNHSNVSHMLHDNQILFLNMLMDALLLSNHLICQYYFELIDVILGHLLRERKNKIKVSSSFFFVGWFFCWNVKNLTFTHFFFFMWKCDFFTFYMNVKICVFHIFTFVASACFNVKMRPFVKL